MIATELRIGNETWKGTVIGIYPGPYGHKIKFSDFHCDESEVKAIELNEKALIKLGFEKQNNRFITKNWSGLFIESLSQFYLKRSTPSGIIEITFGFKYVHELQNLYFALTGEELKWI